MKATRRTAREWAIQMLTAADLNPPAGVEELMASFWIQQATIEEEDGGTGMAAFGGLKRLAEEYVTGVLGAREHLDQTIEGLLAKDWDVFRLGTVERAVMRLAVWEMENTDVPKPVAINEAVDLVNWFSTPKSRVFVNAALDRYAKGLPRT